MGTVSTVRYCRANLSVCGRSCLDVVMTYVSVGIAWDWLILQGLFFFKKKKKC